MKKTVEEKNNSFKIINPPFHYLRQSNWPYATKIVATTSAAEVYSERLGRDLSWVPASAFLGEIMPEDNKWRVYHPSGSSIGVADSRLEAAEGLLGLYCSQHAPIATTEENSECPSAEAA